MPILRAIVLEDEQKNIKIPVIATQHCPLRMCKQEHIQQTTQEGHYTTSSHVHHTTYGILQYHPLTNNHKNPNLADF